MASSRSFVLKDELTRVVKAVDQIQKYGEAAEKASTLPHGSESVFDKIRLRTLSTSVQKQLTEIQDGAATIASFNGQDLESALVDVKALKADRDELRQNLVNANNRIKGLEADRDSAREQCDELRTQNQDLRLQQQQDSEELNKLKAQIATQQLQQLKTGQAYTQNALHNARMSTPERADSPSGSQRRPSTHSLDTEPNPKRRVSRQSLPRSASVASQLSLREEEEPANTDSQSGLGSGPPYSVATSMARLVKASALSEADFESFKPQLEEQLQAKSEKHQEATLRQCGNLSPSNEYCFLAKLNKAPNTIKPRKALERCEFCTRRDLKCCWLVAQEDGKLEVHLRS